jgi:hypothetical protein
MFFADPVAAFTNIGQALRPGARLALLVWQARELNEWTVTFHDALTGHAELPPLPATGHPFSLADPDRVREILAAAGFTGIGFDDVRDPISYGPDLAVAIEMVTTLTSSADLLSRLDPAGRDRALGRLRDALAAHDDGESIRFGARAWVVTAQRL